MATAAGGIAFTSRVSLGKVDGRKLRDLAWNSCRQCEEWLGRGGADSDGRSWPDGGSKVNCMRQCPLFSSPTGTSRRLSGDIRLQQGQDMVWIGRRDCRLYTSGVDPSWRVGVHRKTSLEIKPEPTKIANNRLSPSSSLIPAMTLAGGNKSWTPVDVKEGSDGSPARVEQLQWWLSSLPVFLLLPLLLSP